MNIFKKRLSVLTSPLTMDQAFDRLTMIQKNNVNKQMFVVAYNCVIQSRGDPAILQELVSHQTADCPHLAPDLIRYCRLVESVK